MKKNSQYVTRLQALNSPDESQAWERRDRHAQASSNKSKTVFLFLSFCLSLGNKKEREEELPSEVLVISC